MEEQIQQTRRPGVKNALAWKLLERFGVQGIQFLLQLVLARILDPEHYGVLSLMVVFTGLANVFIQTGFNTALMQNKDVTERDYSSVFWVTLSVSALLYGIIFFSAPLIGSYYGMPDIVAPLRILALMLFPGALNSVQLAKVSRELDFKKVFTGNVVAISVAGICGITVALLGGGLWALVIQSLMNVAVAALVMSFTVRWRIRFICDLKRIRVLFSFGWKLLASGLLDTVYQDIRSLVIGKKYNSETLGFYDRGKQFPQFIIVAVNSTVQSVMLPVLSARQDDREQVRQLTRQSISLSAYVLFPVMAGLAGVASPLVEVLLGEKWLFCVPYLQIYCFTFAFNPIHSCNLQAVNAMGRSDVFLKLELIKKAIGISALAAAVFFFDSPIAIALSGALTTLTSCFINAYPNRKLIGYSYWDQMVDIFPSLMLSLIMLGAVLSVGMLSLPPVLLLILQVVCGVAVYALLSFVTRISPFRMLLGLLKK